MEPPYALVILVAEALVVGVPYRPGLRNLVLADLAYWVVIGARAPRPATLRPGERRPSDVLFHTLLALTLLAGAAPIVTDAPDGRIEHADRG